MAKRVGVYLPAGKAAKLQWDAAFAAYALEHGNVHIVLLDLAAAASAADVARAAGGPLDLLVCKITDDLAALQDADREAAASSPTSDAAASRAATLRRRLDALAAYVAEQAPHGLRVVDPLAAQHVVLDRSALSRCFADVEARLGSGSGGSDGSGSGGDGSGSGGNGSGSGGGGNGTGSGGGGNGSGNGMPTLRCPRYVAFDTAADVDSAVAQLEAGAASSATTTATATSATATTSTTCTTPQPSTPTTATTTTTTTLPPYTLADLQFPVIVKPQRACGSSESHNMAVVFAARDLRQFAAPLVVQEYRNHGGVIFKVFVLAGADRASTILHVVRRKSVRDVAPPPAAHEPPRAPIVFHSAMTSALPPQLDPALSDAEAGGAPPMVPPETPPLATFRTLAHELAAAVGVTLFGFDVVVERDSGALGVVDLNFFPSFRGCENIQRDMLAFLVARMDGAAVKPLV